MGFVYAYLYDYGRFKPCATVQGKEETKENKICCVINVHLYIMQAGDFILLTFQSLVMNLNVRYIVVQNDAKHLIFKSCSELNATLF